MDSRTNIYVSSNEFIVDFFFGCNTSQNHGNMVFIYLCNLIEKSNNNSSKRHRKGGRKIKMQDKH